LGRGEAAGGDKVVLEGEGPGNVVEVVRAGLDRGG